MVIVGLGNPGTHYAATRHNVGFRVVETLGRRLGAVPVAWPGCPARVEVGRIGDRDVALVRPETWMNRSGAAVVAALAACSMGLDRLIVTYDDADLPLGRLRVRPGGSAGGHNGVRSVMDTLGSGAFVRVRLGVAGEGRETMSLADYVLAPFAPEEAERVEAMVGRGSSAVESVVREGVSRAMNTWNGLPDPETSDPGGGEGGGTAAAR